MDWVAPKEILGFAIASDVWNWISYACLACVMGQYTSKRFFLRICLSGLAVAGISYFWSIYVLSQIFFFFAIMYSLRHIEATIWPEPRIGTVFFLRQPLRGVDNHAIIGHIGQNWKVEGPDLPKGTAVIVRSIDGDTLRIEKYKLATEDPSYIHLFRYHLMHGYIINDNRFLFAINVCCICGMLFANVNYNDSIINLLKVWGMTIDKVTIDEILEFVFLLWMFPAIVGQVIFNHEGKFTRLTSFLFKTARQMDELLGRKKL